MREATGLTLALTRVSVKAPRLRPEGWQGKVQVLGELPSGAGQVAASPQEPLKSRRNDPGAEISWFFFAPSKDICKAFKQELNQRKKKPPSPSPVLTGLGGTPHHRPARKFVFPTKTNP